MKRGFTLVELLVVIAMLMLLVGAVTSSVTRAQKRAKIVQATAEAQEITNAILAYENYAEKYSLEKHAKGGWEEATEGNMGFILGQESSGTDEGGKVPVLYNASIRGGAIRDPWGHPYRVRIIQADTIDGGAGEESSTDNLKNYAFVTFPNFNRRPAKAATATTK